MLTPKRLSLRMRGSNCADWATQMRISSGRNETEVKEFAVMPWTWPGARAAVTTVTPVANCPSAWRKSDVLGVIGAILEVFDDNTDEARGRVSPSRIIIAKVSGKERNDGAHDCDFRWHRAGRVRLGESAGNAGGAHRD